MTLETAVRFVGDPPISGPEFFLIGRRVANIHFEWPFEVSKRGSIRHVPGCSTALAKVDFSAPFPVLGVPGMLRFDTPYSFLDDNGDGCREVHDRIIRALFDVADEEGWAIEWRNDLGEETDPWLRERPPT